jgi:hypothetical protein
MMKGAMTEVSKQPAALQTPSAAKHHLCWGHEQVKRQCSLQKEKACIFCPIRARRFAIIRMCIILRRLILSRLLRLRIVRRMNPHIQRHNQRVGGKVAIFIIGAPAACLADPRWKTCVVYFVKRLSRPKIVATEDTRRFPRRAILLLSLSFLIGSPRFCIGHICCSFLLLAFAASRCPNVAQAAPSFPFSLSVSLSLVLSFFLSSFLSFLFFSFLSLFLSFFLYLFLSFFLYVCLSFFFLYFFISCFLYFCRSFVIYLLFSVFLYVSLFLSVFRSFFLSFFLSFCLYFCLFVFFQKKLYIYIYIYV